MCTMFLYTEAFLNASECYMFSNLKKQVMKIEKHKEKSKKLIVLNKFERRFENKSMVRLHNFSSASILRNSLLLASVLILALLPL